MAEFPDEEEIRQQRKEEVVEQLTEIYSKISKKYIYLYPHYNNRCHVALHFMNKKLE